MLTDQDIERAKSVTNYGIGKAHHEHPDCIRIAYEWLDAQKKTMSPTKRTRAIKHIIEKWGGRYVSTSDVEVAAQMHPDIKGTYPHFNISARLTEPSKDRLKGIAEAFTQDQHKRHDPNIYSTRE